MLLVLLQAFQEAEREMAGRCGGSIVKVNGKQLEVAFVVVDPAWTGRGRDDAYN